MDDHLEDSSVTWIVDYMQMPPSRSSADPNGASPRWVAGIVRKETGEILDTRRGTGVPGGRDILRVVTDVAATRGFPDTILTDNHWAVQSSAFESGLKATGVAHQYKPWVGACVRALLSTI